MADPRSLHEVVLAALEFHERAGQSALKLPKANRRLVVGSGNALPTGRIIFRGDDAVFADEGQYVQVLDRIPAIDSAVLISASGDKDAPGIIDTLKSRGLETVLITCTERSPAAGKLNRDHVVATPSCPEPPTYNTSTYLGMIICATGERPARILEHIQRVVAPAIPDDLSRFQAYYLMVQPRFDSEREMLLTKFDELFGGRINGRCFTDRQTAHAKTVVPWDKECVISFNCESPAFSHKRERLRVPLFDGAGDAAMVAIGYYVIGRIQEQNPPWFFDNIDDYSARQGDLFR